MKTFEEARDEAAQAAIDTKDQFTFSSNASIRLFNHGTEWSRNYYEPLLKEALSALEAIVSNVEQDRPRGWHLYPTPYRDKSIAVINKIKAAGVE